MNEFITPEMEKKLETLEKHSVYLEGYSDGLWSMWRGTQLVMGIVLVVLVLGWAGATIYMLVSGAC